MKASVLMSIFNETEDEIRTSVMSVLEQTFDDYEFIIVHDNPESKTKDNIIQWLRNIDSRIIVVENDLNIGLAMSMNKAFNISTGEIIIRMDSDDICEPDRFRREIELLESHKWDLIFTNYTIIDSNGETLYGGRTAIETKNADESLLTEVIFDGIIHHPTVAMTRDIFLKSGGYRNFPCSQDLDLWLRMIECGCRFLYINESFLKYRLRDNSITGSKRLKQHLTITYIILLFAQRLKRGYDDYSDDQYNQFVESKTSDLSKKRYEKAISDLQNARDADNKLKKTVLRAKAFCFCAPLRFSYLYKITLKKWFIKKIEKENKGKVTII